MDNLFDRVVDLLGKTPTDPSAVQFVDDIGKQSIVPMFLIFPSLGFAVIPSDVSNLTFTDAIFSLSEKYNKLHRFSAKFSGNLPNSILDSDHRDTIRNKMGSSPTRTFKVEFETHDVYQLPSLRIEFVFDTNDLPLAMSVSKDKSNRA